jgi:large subunit ribosomal protein L10
VRGANSSIPLWAKRFAHDRMCLFGTRTSQVTYGQNKCGVLIVLVILLNNEFRKTNNNGMKSKAQKNQELADARELMEKAQSLVFVNFSKTPVSKVSGLKASLREAGGTYKVMKKRLFKILFQEKNVPVDMGQFDSQFAAVFSPQDISEAAGTVYRFAKEQEKEGSAFSLVGGADIAKSIAYGAEDIVRIGKLPSREVLLAQLAGMLNAPLRQLAYTISKVGESKGA